LTEWLPLLILPQSIEAVARVGCSHHLRRPLVCASIHIALGVSYTSACTTNAPQFRVVAAEILPWLKFWKAVASSLKSPTVKLTPDKQDEVINLMIERARFMATQPGFVSIALHRSKDGSHVVNYVQWRDAESLAAAHHSPEFRKKWPQFGKIADEIEPCLYDLVHVEAAE
jgi:heme-degrading monooxygenase HmoA